MASNVKTVKIGKVRLEETDEVTIDLPDGYEILDTIVIDGFVDLMDYRNNLIITANQGSHNTPINSVSVIQVQNNKLKFLKNIDF